MNTKKCKYCQEEIAKKAKRCPKCGGKFGLPTIVKILIIIVIIFGVIIGCASSCSNAIDEASNSYKDTNGKTTFKINESFQNSYEKITMTEVNTNFTDYSKYLGPADGNKIIMAKFEVENINKDDDSLYVSSLEFDAYYDGVAAESFWSAGDNYKDLSATLGYGKKAIGYVFYEVPINAKSITIEYNPNFWVDGNKIEFIIQ